MLFAPCSFWPARFSKLNFLMFNLFLARGRGFRFDVEVIKRRGESAYIINRDIYCCFTGLSLLCVGHAS